jgi:hypothetical protein
MVPSISNDSDEAEAVIEEEKIPTDPLDLVDYKVKHSALTETQNTKISATVEKFCTGG